MSTRTETRLLSARVSTFLPPGRAATLQRQCACGQRSQGGESEPCKKRNAKLQRVGRSGVLDGAPAPPIVAEELRAAGQPLDTGTRRFMESRFDHDFSRVRVHNSERPAASATSVDALAYTVGNNGVFNREARPRTEAVVGSPLWSPDLITIPYFPLQPHAKRVDHQESCAFHRDCPTSLGIPGTVMREVEMIQIPAAFRDGHSGQAVARAITPPRVSLEYQFPMERPVLHGKEGDPNAAHVVSGVRLATKLNVRVEHNGALEIDTHLDDQECGTQRRYHDHITVEADRPCGGAPAGQARPASEPATVARGQK